MSVVLLDAAVFVYASGGEHPLREPCLRLLRRGGDGSVELAASVEAIQEFVHHRLRRTSDRRQSIREGLAATESCTIFDFDRRVLRESLALINDYPSIRGRDAVHAATALVNGVDRIVSPDRAFDGISGLTRVDPLEFA